MSHATHNAPDIRARIRRIAGQLAGIERALEQGASCADLLQQTAAVRGATGALLEELIAEHLREHVAHPARSDAERAAAAEEVVAAIRRYGR